MYSLTLENERGDQLTFNDLGGPFTIDEISGLNPAPAIINTSEMALSDGQQFNGAKLEMRTLSIAFAIEYDAAENRITAFRVCRPKHGVKVYYQSETRDVYIEGYVQSVDVTYFEMKQVCTVEIICPYPYWQAAQGVVNELSSVINMFRFPFTATGTQTGDTPIVFGYIDYATNVQVINDGESETGLVFELRAFGTITNPKIYDYETGAFIGLNFTMQLGDLVTINTNPGKKSVTLQRDGVTSNIFNALMKGITWLQLPFGGGVYALEVESGEPGDLRISISHNDLYEGV